MTDGSLPEQGESANPGIHSREDLQVKREENFQKFIDKDYITHAHALDISRHTAYLNDLLFVEERSEENKRTIKRSYFSPTNINGEATFQQNAYVEFDFNTDQGYSFSSLWKQAESYDNTGKDGTYWGFSLNEVDTISFPLSNRSLTLVYSKNGEINNLYASSIEDDHIDSGYTIWEFDNATLKNATEPQILEYLGGKEQFEITYDAESGSIILKNKTERKRPDGLLEIEAKLESKELKPENLTQEQRHALSFFGTSKNPVIDEVEYRIPGHIDRNKIIADLFPEWTHMLEDPFSQQPQDDKPWAQRDLLKVIGIQKEVIDTTTPLR